MLAIDPCGPINDRNMFPLHDVRYLKRPTHSAERNFFNDPHGIGQDEPSKPSEGWWSHFEEVRGGASHSGELVSPRHNQKAVSLSDRVTIKKPAGGTTSKKWWSHIGAGLSGSVTIQKRLAEPFRRNGGARRDRTDDLKLAKLALSQLSYGPEPGKHPAAGSRSRPEGLRRVVGLGGLEPPTSRLSSARSNQLSYKPVTLTSNQTPHAPQSAAQEPGGLVLGRKRNEDGGCPARSA
jgi:hypothetical protein